MRYQDEMHVFRYRFDKGIIFKEEFILKFEMYNYKHDKCYCVCNLDGSKIAHRYISEEKINRINSNSIYLTSEQDDTVLEYFRNKYKYKIAEAENVIKTCNNYLSNLCIKYK